jgi:hypothetical protein
MRRRRKRHRPEPICVKRILGEVSTTEKHGSGRYRCKLNLSEILGTIPMTVNQDDIEAEAVFKGGNLTLIVYCDEWIGTPENPVGGGVYSTEEIEEVIK